MKNKSLLLVSGLLLAASAQASGTQVYSCVCIDTGLECDGGEKMDLIMINNKISATVTDVDGDFARSFTAEYDDSYVPQVNKSYARYLTKIAPKNQLQSYPYFLIEKKMMSGAKKGSVKMPEMGNGSFGWEWYYECKLSGSQG